MKILFTGASSFTGYWFVKTLAAAGHEIVCPLRGTPEQYNGVRKLRVEKLQTLCRLVPLAPFGSSSFFDLVRGGGQWDVLCHHATESANYKSAEFDVTAALQSNTLNLRAGLSALKNAGLRGAILTGSVFENDEGKGDEPLRAFSGYGLSKGLTWQAFRFFCHEAQIALGKLVIPNPFGPLEEPRFTAYLLKNWREGKTAGVKTPDYLRDNIHVDLLAAAYGDFLNRVAALNSGVIKINPSGYVETQEEFAQRVAREVQKRLGWECKLELSKQEDFGEPLRRVNTDPVASHFPNWNESRAWDDFAEFYGTGQ
ncbi:MAG TPA: NAD(P)-dependent oxidoreductase [Candidatus Acidoferrum sp.]|nr:NAD(P)-dependent oxidoreductase [Candidatus Acidoferrum sp.]